MPALPIMITEMRKHELSRAFTLLLMPGVALALSAANAGATYPGANGKIAFSVPAGAGSAIFVMDPDGKHVRQLTSGNRSDMHPALSADGQSIAFERIYGNSGLGIYVIAAADGVARHVPKTSAADDTPAFAPDGRQIAFQSSRTGGTQIWRIGLDGKHLRQLTNSGLASHGPAYSPDGRRIAFVRSFHVFVMNADGSHESLVTRGRYDADPKFSPDGRRIVFTRNDDIYVLTLKGHHLLSLTRTRTSESAPTFSPNGRKIVFSRAESNSGFGFDKRGIYVMRADGTHTRRLGDVPSAGLDWQPLGGEQLWRPLG